MVKGNYKLRDIHLLSSASFLFPAFLFLPTVASAADTPQDFKGFVGILINLVGYLTILAAGFAAFALIVGILIFVFNLSGRIKLGGEIGGDDPVSDGKRLMLWGIIGLFIVFSFWGILRAIHIDIFGASFDALPLLQENS